MAISSNNIWTLEKDISISSLLIMLQHEVGADGFMLLDETLLNEKAVRVIAPATQQELSAYIYSYAQPEGRYGLDLEFPFLIETRADDQSIRMNNLGPGEVIDKTISHLEIPRLGRDKS